MCHPAALLSEDAKMGVVIWEGEMQIQRNFENKWKLVL